MSTGAGIRVYKDGWIPSGPSFLVQSRPLLPPYSRVCDLRTLSGLWDENKIRAHFSDEEATSILNISLLNCSVDKQIWHYENRSLFTVKSGYKLAQQYDVYDFPSPSSSENLCLCRGELWKMHITSKIRLFIWRLCLDRLPTGNNMAFRGVDVRNECRFYGQYG